jgi:ParB-like chromosome segregation protein Spo0J
MYDTEIKPGEFTFRDPKTLQPHPVSAALYLEGRYGFSTDAKQVTPLEASNEIMEGMDVRDLMDSIKRDGIRVPLVVTPEGIIISGCRRWKCAMRLGLTRVPVEVQIFEKGAEEKLAIIEYNRYRDKTFSQKMREAELTAEIAGISAKKKIITGKKDPTPILGEGLPVKRHEKESRAIAASGIGIGTETFRKGEKIWNKAKQGDPKAIELVEKLDNKKTSVDAAFNIVKKVENHADSRPLSKWQSAEPIGEGPICTCPTCGKSYRLVHCKSGKHRPVETSESDTPNLRLQQQIKIL